MVPTLTYETPAPAPLPRVMSPSKVRAQLLRLPPPMPRSHRSQVRCLQLRDIALPAGSHPDRLLEPLDQSVASYRLCDRHGHAIMEPGDDPNARLVLNDR